MSSILITRLFSCLHFAYLSISEMLESHKRAAMYIWPPVFNSRALNLIKYLMLELVEIANFLPFRIFF